MSSASLSDALISLHAALQARSGSKPSADSVDAAPAALQALHALHAEAAGPIAWSIRGALQRMANDARVAFLRQHPVSQTYLLASNVKVQPATPLSAPWYRCEYTRLGDEAPSIDALDRFLSTEHGRINPFEFEFFIWEVAGALRHAAGSKGPDDRRQIADGLDDAHLALARAAQSVVEKTMEVLPFATMMTAASEGVGNDEGSAPAIAARADLASAEACIPFIEKLFVTGRGDWLAALLIARVGEQKHAPAAPLLSAIAVARASAVQGAALDALAAIGGSFAGDALLAALVHEIDEGGRLHWDASHGGVHVRRVLQTLLAIDAARDPRGPLALFAPLLSPSRCATAAGALVAREALSALQGSFLGHAHAVTSLIVGHSAPHPTLADDPRWLSFLVPLLENRRLASSSKLVLASLDATRVKAALTEATERAAIARPAHALGKPAPEPKSRRWLARYEKGEHEEVWRELASLGELAGDPKLASEVQAVADATMARVGRNLAILIARLRKAKVPLKASAKVLEKAASATEIEKIEKIAKRRLPALLRAFYVIIGGVDFSRALDLQGHVPPRTGLLRGDALVMQALKYPAKRFEAEQRDWKGIPEALLPPPALYLAPDAKLRLDVRAADDDPTYVDISLPVADPAIYAGHVAHEGETQTLLGHLRASLASAGFLGAEPDSIAPLVKGLESF